MKKKVIITGCILLVSILVLFIYTQFIKPIDCKINAISCITWDATYVSLESFHERYHSGDLIEKQQVIYSYDGTLPSNNPKDYMDFYFEVGVNNRSLTDDVDVNVIVSSIDKYKDRVLYGYNSDQMIPGYAHKMSSGQTQILFTAYIANMTDEQIKEMAKSVTIRATAEGENIGSRVQNISCDTRNIKIENSLSSGANMKVYDLKQVKVE